MRKFPIEKPTLLGKNVLGDHYSFVFRSKKMNNEHQDARQLVLETTTDGVESPVTSIIHKRVRSPVDSCNLPELSFAMNVPDVENVLVIL